MNVRRILAYARAAIWLSAYAFTIQPDMPSVKVRNAVQAVDAALAYLRKQQAPKAPDTNTKWQEKTLYSTERQDYAVTSKLFTSDDWLIEVYQGVAPLSSTVYQITVFNTKLHCYWKGNVKAGGSITEENTFRALSEDESKKISEEFSRKSQVPPPRLGGYGH